MKFSLKVEGWSQLERNLAKLPDAVGRKVRVAALLAAAEPIRQEAEILAPYDSDGGAPHLTDNIAVRELSEASLISKGRDTETVVEVGPELKPDDIFYAFFQEFGTAHHGAQAFMRPAFDSRAREAMDIISDELWHGIKRGVDEF